MKIFAFIFARGGSKGLKNKNLKRLKGSTLVARTINQAKKINKISQVFISSDDNRILREGVKKGAFKIKRPKYLCNDDSSEMNSWLHAINYLKKKNIIFDLMLVLPCTSPLRSNEDILLCLKNYKKNLHMIMTIFKTKYHPALNILKKNKLNFVKKLMNDKRIYQRQKIKDTYLIANSVYLFDPKKFTKNPTLFGKKVLGIEIPKKRAIDIDDEIDFKLCKTLI